jgi:hypothetical protein
VRKEGSASFFEKKAAKKLLLHWTVLVAPSVAHRPLHAVMAVKAAIHAFPHLPRSQPIHCAAPTPPPMPQINKSFLLLFFKKEALASSTA